MIKTITLTGTEQEVAIDSSTYCWVQNLGGANLLISLSSGIVDGADNVLTIPSGGAGYVRDDKGVKKLYILGTGKAQVYGTNNAFCPFKVGSKGGGNVTGDYLPVSGGTMEGTLIAQNNTDYAVAQVRNVIISSEAPSGTAPEGTIWYQYEV